MSKAEEMRARAARVAQRSGQAAAPGSEAANQPTPTPTPMPPAPKPAVVRSKPVRITADLPPQSYRSLIDFAASLATRFGRARLPHVNVIRALVLELEEDQALQGRIASRIANDLDG
jgi:hypothetical protein